MQVLKTTGLQPLLHGLCWDKSAHSAVMIVEEVSIRPAYWDRGACSNVFGKLGMQGGSKGQPPLATQPAGCMPERSFRCNVDGVRAKRSQLLSNTFLWEEGKANGRIRRAGISGKRLWRDTKNLMPGCFELLTRVCQRPHDTIDLGMPGIGNNRDSHRSGQVGLGSGACTRCQVLFPAQLSQQSWKPIVSVSAVTSSI